MKKQRLGMVWLIAGLMVILGLACRGTSGETSNEGLCGDGVCDQKEQSDPKLCPQDCLPGAESTPDELVCNPGQWTLVIDGCGTLAGTEPSNFLCTIITACIEVNEACQIEGTGSGEYTNCDFSSPQGVCSYEIECPDFEMPIRGQVVIDENGEEIFKIFTDASNIFEEGVQVCAGVTFELPWAQLQNVFGSAVRNGNGYFCEMKINQSGLVEQIVSGVDAVASQNLSYEFTVQLIPGCQ